MEIAVDTVEEVVAGRVIQDGRVVEDGTTDGGAGEELTGVRESDGDALDLKSSIDEDESATEGKGLPTNIMMMTGEVVVV